MKNLFDAYESVLKDKKTSITSLTQSGKYDVGTAFDFIASLLKLGFVKDDGNGEFSLCVSEDKVREYMDAQGIVYTDYEEEDEEEAEGEEDDDFDGMTEFERHFFDDIDLDDIDDCTEADDDTMESDDRHYYDYENDPENEAESKETVKKTIMNFLSQFNVDDCEALYEQMFGVEAEIDDEEFENAFADIDDTDSDDDEDGDN